MSNTPQKGFPLQVTGTNVGTWGTVVNNSILSILDNNLGGTLPISVAGNSNINLTSAQAAFLTHNLTGVLTGNIQYIFPALGGFYTINNGTTGAFTVTVAVVGGTGVVIATQGASTNVTVDATGLNVTTQTNATSAAAAGTLTGTTLASNVVNSSLTGVGTITSGVWNGTALTVPYGGLGTATLPVNNLIVGNGTSSPNFIAPGASGNILTSTGTAWASSAPGAGGVTTTGLPSTGNLTKFSAAGTITNADLSGDISTSGGTIATLPNVNSNVGSFTNASVTVNAKGQITAASTGTVPLMAALGVGSIIFGGIKVGTASAGGSVAASNITPIGLNPGTGVPTSTGDTLSGTWQALQNTGAAQNIIPYQRTA